MRSSCPCDEAKAAILGRILLPLRFALFFEIIGDPRIVVCMARVFELSAWISRGSLGSFRVIRLNAFDTVFRSKRRSPVDRAVRVVRVVGIVGIVRLVVD